MASCPTTPQVLGTIAWGCLPLATPGGHRDRGWAPGLIRRPRHSEAVEPRGRVCLGAACGLFAAAVGGRILVQRVSILAAATASTLAVLSCSDTAGPSAPTSVPTATSQRPAVSSSATARPHLWVLSIGVSQYGDPSLRLQYAAADAQAFADVLQRQEHGPLYDTVHTAVLVDEGATRESILQALETFLGNAAPVDVAVLFLAGHGIRTERPTAYYFLTRAASPAAPHIAGLDMAELSRQLQRLHRNIPRMVVVLDTCHAGAVTQTTDRVLLGTDLAPALAPAEGLYILTAARAGERSFELTQQQHGAFTAALLDGLSGAAAGADGLITVFGLASHASRVAQQLTNDQQRPYIAMIGEDLTVAADPRRLAQITPPPGRVRLARAEPAPQRERVAIRDFEHLGPNTSYDWMRRALTQDVLTAFSELHQLDVYDEDMLRFVTRETPDVLEAAQRAGIGMLVEGRYWVQDNQLSVIAQVKSVRPLQLMASARTQGPVDQFSQLTGGLVISLLDQLPVEVPSALGERLRHPSASSLTARRLLTEADGEGDAAPPPTPGAPRSAVAPRASLWRQLRPQLHSFAALGVARPILAAPPPDLETELEVMLESYRRALQAEDLGALRAHYEDFTDGQSRALARYFENAAGLEVEFRDIRVAIIGDAAAVSFTRRDRFKDRGTGQPQEVTVRVTKRFVKGDRGWLIQREP